MNYGYSSIIPDDDRQEKWKKQREERGFDDTEFWSLFTTIARFIHPRLKTWIDYEPVSYPPEITYEEWMHILKVMERSFRMIADDNFFAAKDYKEVKEGLDLFHEYYLHLWD